MSSAHRPTNVFWMMAAWAVLIMAQVTLASGGESAMAFWQWS